MYEKIELALNFSLFFITIFGLLYILIVYDNQKLLRLIDNNNEFIMI